MMNGFLLFLHLAGVFIWLGGMFFAVLCLHPSLAALAGKDRVALMSGTLGRFLNYVIVAILLIWASGAGLLAGASPASMPPGWHVMIGAALLMTLIFVYLYLGVFRRVRRAIAGGDMAQVPALMGRIRSLVIVNLVLGTIAVAGVTLLA
jgi:uncharacterized membrane protein